MTEPLRVTIAIDLPDALFTRLAQAVAAAVTEALKAASPAPSPVAPAPIGVQPAAPPVPPPAEPAREAAPPTPHRPGQSVPAPACAPPSLAAAVGDHRASANLRNARAEVVPPPAPAPHRQGQSALPPAPHKPVLAPPPAPVIAEPPAPISDDRVEIIRRHPPKGVTTRPDSLITPERYAVLETMWPAGVPVGEIHARLNALPGRPFLRERVSIMAAQLGFRRPSVRVDLDARRSDAPPAETIDWDQAKAWAGFNGVELKPTFDRRTAMDHINQKRRYLDLPPWVLVETNRKLEDLPAPSRCVLHGA